MLKHIAYCRFDRAVKYHVGNHRIRALDCRTQFAAMIYAQLAQRFSIHDL
ncbi:MULTISPECIES: DUF4372 domain-containing protein [Nitrosomonas]